MNAEKSTDIYGDPNTVKQKVLVIAGPTASGKSATALLVAEAVGGEIISADSMQLYRGLDIGTAKVTPAEQQRVRHHLVDILDPAERFSVAAWQGAALDAIADILARGKLPIVCGGTGQYISSLLEGLSFTPIAVNLHLRQELNERADREGTAAMLAEVAEFDPATAARLHLKDRKRIIRAHEVYRLSGKSPSQLNAESRSQPVPYSYQAFCLWPERALLYKRIEQRVDAMLAQGLIKEVESLKLQNLPIDAPCRQAIGYKEVFAYLAGEASLSETSDRIKQVTRNYAKRQLTWFRRITEIERIETASPQAAAQHILERICLAE